MTWDRQLYFPSEGGHAEDFYHPKNPTALARFEPANLGTKGQHATPRPPKPRYTIYMACKIYSSRSKNLQILYNVYVCIIIQNAHLLPLTTRMQ